MVTDGKMPEWFVDAVDRFLVAVEQIAASMVSISSVQLKRYERDYPARKEPTDATITHRQTEEERLRESQGASDETDAAWVGQREARYEADEARKKNRSRKGRT